MKKILIALLLLTGNLALAQKIPYNVVFDVTSGDTVVHQMVMRWATGIMESDPEANVEVVFYAKSLGMVTKDKSVVAADVIKLAASKRVSFTVCEAAMKRNNVEKSDLLSGVGTVPDGIYQIIKRQHEGWGYIKAAK